jgi:hypothetical protein
MWRSAARFARGIHDDNDIDVLDQHRTQYEPSG